MIGAENMANASGDSFAMLFGVTSPKMRMMTVMTIVDTVAARLALPLIKDAKRIDTSVLMGNTMSIEDTKHKVSKFSDLFANKRKRK